MLMKDFELIVWNTIEVAEQMDLGMFVFRNKKGNGWVYNISTEKIYRVGDFIDWVIHEKAKRLLMEKINEE